VEKKQLVEEVVDVGAEEENQGISNLHPILFSILVPNISSCIESFCFRTNGSLA